MVVIAQLSLLNSKLSTAFAQGPSDKACMIALNPFISDEENLDQAATSLLLSKLSQIATIAGMTGEGFDNRFIITSHLQEIEASSTATFPPKFSVKLNIGIYVGDGIDGTLYSSYVKEVKGIGDSKENAYASAVKKLQVRDPMLQQSINLGKERIVEYYDNISSNILNTAKAQAGSGYYEEAISMLFSIPMPCKDYQAAQQLITEYGTAQLENANQLLINSARAAWSMAPNDDGAAQAAELLNQLTAPSARVLAEAKALNNEIAARLKAVSDREWKFTIQQEQHEHDKQMARIKSDKEQNIAAYNAAASVARAYYRSRPRVVYHVHNWW